MAFREPQMARFLFPVDFKLPHDEHTTKLFIPRVNETCAERRSFSWVDCFFSLSLTDLLLCLIKLVTVSRSVVVLPTTSQAGRAEHSFCVLSGGEGACPRVSDSS